MTTTTTPTLSQRLLTAWSKALETLTVTAEPESDQCVHDPHDINGDGDYFCFESLNGKTIYWHVFPCGGHGYMKKLSLEEAVELLEGWTEC